MTTPLKSHKAHGIHSVNIPLGFLPSYRLEELWWRNQSDDLGDRIKYAVSSGARTAIDQYTSKLGSEQMGLQL